ncbi:MAG: DUF5686 family protein [Candidatus Cryptobacteroides sp.]
MFLAFFCFCNAAAQETKVKGRVTDASTGEPVPFAGVYFKGTTTGMSTDLDGNFSFGTRDTATVLCAYMLGYEPGEVKIKSGGFNEANFRLTPSPSSLNAAVVKPDNRYMIWILSQIERNRDRNDPERRGAYKCETYTKMELDIANPEKTLDRKIIRNNFGFMADYLDTSVVSGQPFLPVLISETKAKKFHSASPEVSREIITATRISGMDSENALSQFTGTMHLRTNFYDNFIYAFDIQIPSPLGVSGRSYYNYYLVDSLEIEGRKTWKIRFHPKKEISSPVFDGEMSIDSTDFAMREIHVKLMKGSNVNWIRSAAIDREDRIAGDSLWFYKSDKLTVDFSLTMRDSSKMVSFLGSRATYYGSPIPVDADSLASERGRMPVVVEKGAAEKDDEWWDNARPYSLSERERGIYSMVDSVKTVPLFNSLQHIITTVGTGYLHTKYIEFGPYGKLYSFNKIEGSRFQAGIRTTSDFSRKFRFTGYGAFGMKDQEFKGGASAEWMLSRLPTRKLTLSGKRDILQLGKGSGSFTETSIITSILTKKGSEKRSPVNEYSLRFDWEILPWLNTSTTIESRRIYSNSFVPMFRTADKERGPDTLAVNSVCANSLRFCARFSKDETVNRGTFEKYYMFSDYPVVTLDLSGSLKGIGRNEYSYFRSEVKLNYNLRLPPAGTSRIQFTAGKIIGKVPYPFLKLYEGNGTYILDRNSFSTMEYYEFASDTWTTLFWEHNFGGFFLNRIPFVKALHWREVLTVKAAYGTLSKRNNGVLGEPESSGAPLLFPAGMNSLNKPFIEMGAGITNIFNLLRVDAFWRLTHRNIKAPDGTIRKSPNRCIVNIGVELSF